jgi:adenosine deaminase
MRDLLRLPKANLHVHLEDAIRPRTVAEIAGSHGMQLPPGTPITDAASFFAAHDVVRKCLLTFADFRRVAAEYCADEAAQGTTYAEVSFTDELVADVARTGVRASFAPADVKAQLESQISAWLA